MVKEEFKNAGRIAHADGMEPEQARKIFIGGLAGSTDEDSLRNYYGQWGEIVDCVVMRDSQTKRSRGFGFVSYATMAEVDVAMANRPHDIDGKRVDPKRAVPREDSSRGQKLPTTKRLYISGIRDGHTEENLREYFSQYGNVEKVEVMLDKATGKPRGFAFISFDDFDPVDRCVVLKSHTIGGFRCDVKRGLSKEEMQTQGDRDRSARGERGPPGGGRGAPGRGRGGWGGNDGSRGGWGSGGDAGGGQRGWGGRGAGAGGGWGAGGNRGGGSGGGGWGASGGWNSQSDGGYGGSGGNWGAAPSAPPNRFEQPSPWAGNPQQAAPSGYSGSGYGASASGYGDYSASGYGASGSGGFGASGSGGYGAGQSNSGSGSGGYGGHGGPSSSWGQPDPWRR